MAERVVLAGIDAIALWKEGKDAWNQWVVNNPEADVDFSGVDFHTYKTAGELISFEEFTFPNGMVSFKNSNFGTGRVTFYRANFGNGDTYFTNATFGPGDVDFMRVAFGDGKVYFVGTTFDEGDVSFFRSTFSEGDISFVRAKFGKGDLSFTNAQLGNGNIDFGGAEFGIGDVNFIDAVIGEGYLSFHEVTFKDGNVSFYQATLGNGPVVFVNATFGKGEVSFAKACLGEGEVSFNRTQFNDGNVNFSQTQFGDGKVDFTQALFGDGDVSFSEATFGAGVVTFKGAKWKGSCIFNPTSAEHCKELDFSSTSIDGELSFGAFKTSCVIDLRHSKLNRPIDLDQVEINFEREARNILLFKRATKVMDSTCFRRLKKLAKEADDHQRALDFYASEMRSAYGHTLNGWKLALFFVYDKVSDYGRSLLYPILYLILFTEVFGIIYWWKSTEASSTIYDGLTFSLGHAVPLYAGSREARSANAKALFGSIDHIPDCIHVLTVTQGLACGAFLFLIALALRNLFRS